MNTGNPGPNRSPWPVALLLPAVLLSTQGSSRALPAFSRKYKTSCNTCHVAFPMLNDFGEAFRRNGFQFPQDDDWFVKDKPVTLGAEGWRDLFPQALWPTTLPNLPPVSFRVTMGMDQSEGARDKADFQAPTDVNILAAGTMGEDVSFFFHQGGGIRYYVQFSNLLEETFSDTLLPRYALNLKLGLFEPGVMETSNARRLTATPLLARTVTYTRGGQAGNSFAFDRQIGAEAHGVLFHRFLYVLGAVNGNGDGPDNNSHKDVYGRVAVKIGGMRFSGEEPESDDQEEGGKGDTLFRDRAYVDNSFTLGAFFWLGRFTAFDSVPNRNYDIDFRRVGLDSRLNWWIFDLNCGVMYGKDDNGLDTNYDIASTLYFASLRYIPYPWLIATGRYEKVFFKDPGTKALDNQETGRFVLSATALVRVNLRLTVEGRLNQSLGYPGTEDDMLLLRLDYSF